MWPVVKSQPRILKTVWQDLNGDHNLAATAYEHALGAAANAISAYTFHKLSLGPFKESLCSQQVHKTKHF